MAPGPLAPTGALSLPQVLAKLAQLRPPACAFCKLDKALGIDEDDKPVPAGFTPRPGTTVLFGTIVCDEHVVSAFATRAPVIAGHGPRIVGQ